MAYFGPTLIEKGTFWWWASFSPLHLIWAGTEAVYLFFVLSGYVLTLPFVRGTDRGWLGYYPKRLLRLYLPVWGAVLLGWVWLTVVPRRNFGEGASVWLAAHTSDLTAKMIRADLLLFPYPGATNSALWTLRYEVMFSLLLPLYVLVGRKFPKLNLLKAGLLLGAMVYFSGTQPSFRYFLPMFGLGALMAVEHRRLSEVGNAIRRLRFGRWVWAALAVTALLLLNSYWTMFGYTTDVTRLAYLLKIALVLILVGACLLIFVVVQCSEGSWLSSGPAKWLGTRSFSLYLVHEPIVVSAGLLFGAEPDFLLSFFVAVMASLVIAELFHRLIERPSQRLGQSVERRLESLGRKTALQTGGSPQVGKPVPDRAPSGV